MHEVTVAAGRVYLEDTDAGGVVYHANYLKFMERARTEWLRAHGIDHDELREEHGVVLVLADGARRDSARRRGSTTCSTCRASVVEARGARIRVRAEHVRRDTMPDGDVRRARARRSRLHGRAQRQCRDVSPEALMQPS